MPDAPLRAGESRFPLRHFSQDLAMLLEAGIPLLEALRALREKERKPELATTPHWTV